MTVTVLMAVIGAALLHATWNAMVKGRTDKNLSMGALVLGQAPIAILLLPFVPLPELESWPYLLGGIALHTGYQLFLIRSYSLGEFTQVYPIARGSAPLLVAVVSVLFLGVHLQLYEMLAVLIIGVGIMSMSLVRQKDGQSNKSAAVSAFITGCFIAAYSLVDGTGARVGGTALGFYCWLAIGNAIVFALLMRIRKPGLLSQIPQKSKKVFFIGGGASFVAYALVMWAFTQAPIALVTALRETSIVFALWIGVFFLKEKLNLAKVFSTLVTLLGAALLRLSSQ